MARISSSRLQLQFAKAKEAEGRFAEAAAAYEAAGDMDAVVRLCLERLNQPQRAYAIVRKTQSAEAANQLSRFCLQAQDFGVGASGSAPVNAPFRGTETPACMGGCPKEPSAGLAPPARAAFPHPPASPPTCCHLIPIPMQCKP
jgi:hypothetical protein